MAKKRLPPPDGRQSFIHITAALEAVADTESSAISEATVANQTPAGTEIEGELEGNGRGVELEANLGSHAKAKAVVVGVVTIVEAEVGTHAGEPTEIAAEVPGPLIDTGQVDITPIGTASPSEVGLQTVAAHAPHGREFAAETATESATDTEVLNLCISRTKGKNGHQSNKVGR